MNALRACFFCLISCVCADAALVASYSFSGNVLDGSGNGFDGTIYGASFTQDRLGNASSALSFDGVNDFVELPNLGLEGTVSISGWFSFSGEIWPNHIALLGQATSYSERWQLGASNHELFWYDRRGSDNYPYKLEMETEADIWHHLVAVVSADPSLATKVGLYLDGSYLGSVSSRGFQDIGNSYQIGSFFTEWGWEYSKGMIDDINVFDHALSDDEIQRLYRSASIPEPATAVSLLLGVIGLALRLRKRA